MRLLKTDAWLSRLRPRLIYGAWEKISRTNATSTSHLCPAASPTIEDILHCPLGVKKDCLVSQLYICNNFHMTLTITSMNTTKYELRIIFKPMLSTQRNYKIILWIMPVTKQYENNKVNWFGFWIKIIPILFLIFWCGYRRNKSELWQII